MSPAKMTIIIHKQAHIHTHAYINAYIQMHTYLYINPKSVCAYSC